MNLRQRCKHSVPVILIFLAGSLILPLQAYSADTPQADKSPLAQIKAAFNAAMAKPLQQRIQPLQALEAQIDEQLNAGVADVKQRCRVLEIKYRVRIALAKYNEAHRTFGNYARALKQWDQKDRARATLIEFTRAKVKARELPECTAIADAALEHWNGDQDVAPGLLYYKAKALSRMNGRVNEALPVLNKVIEEFLESPWRPKAMRLLANLQANGAKGGAGAAMGVLSLMEQQYKGTWWEQYAHMKPAMILEVRRGRPQEALARFQESLKKFPDHKFATFIRREISRLRKVIEQQLILDALEDIAKAKMDHCDHPNVMIVRAAPVGDRHASLAGTKRLTVAGASTGLSTSSRSFDAAQDK